MQYKQTTYIPLFEGFCRKNQIDGKKIPANISGVPVKLKVAANDDTKMQGYMNSDEPSGNEGMLFVYDIEDIIGFWMKNVSFPLDIIFFDSDMQEVDRMTMKAYNGEKDEELEIYKPSKPARFAVELPAGWCESNLKDKCKLKF